MTGAGEVHFREIRFTLHKELTDDGETTWWAESSELGRWMACSDTKDGLLDLCREAIDFHDVTADRIVFFGPVEVTHG